ncbi:hypothetical protein J6Q66_00465 [bacterium]|nr:hypothetical protein [bacterium]
MTSFVSALAMYDFSTPSKKGVNLGNGNNTVGLNGSGSSITVGDGNNTITTIGSNNTITAGIGNNNISSYGDENSILVGDGANTIKTVGTDNAIKAGNGNNKIISAGNGTSINAGNGQNTIATRGDNVSITAGNGENKIAFWGDNNKITTGIGADNIKTLDWANGGPTAADEKSQVELNKWKSEVLANHDTAWLQDSDIKALAKGISSTFKYDEKTTRKVVRTYNTEVRDPHRCLYYGTRWTVYKDKTVTTKSLQGVNNANINAGDGNNDILVTLTGKIGNKEVKYSDEYTVKTGTYTRRSPLIVDFNQDGKVSAAAGKGVDLNSDGKGDGAAVDGDKMLAMSDINGNKAIDGNEVFGDQTVDPFTGKKLNAENGFEALELVAKSAEKHTGINCIDIDGNVDLGKLQTALKTVGIELGFISDANNTMLEDLEKVAKINTRNYTEQDAQGDVQHRQLGTYTDTKGNQFKVNDVWFAV